MKPKLKALSRILSIGMCVIFSSTFLFAQDLKIDDERWAESFFLGGIDEEVLSFDSDDEGNVYVGGAFREVNGVLANGIAMWDGDQWHSLNGGMQSDFQATVHSILVVGNQVYVGGGFYGAGDIEANNIAIWDGTQWHALAGGVNGMVYDMAYDNNNLYVGGYRISQADTVTVSNVARWDGAQWHDMGSGLTRFHDIYALAAKNDTLYVGGYFNIEGNEAMNHIMFFDGNTWKSMEDGFNERVYTIALEDGVVYAGGRFTMAGDKTVNYLAEWNGSEWKAEDSGADNYVYSIVAEGKDLYIGGKLTIIHGEIINHVAKWDGASWQGFGQGIGDFYAEVRALFVLGKEIFVGGEFDLVNGKEQKYYAHWNGYKWDDSWRLKDQSVTGTVNAIVLEGKNVYVGGKFLMAGGDTVHNIAKWDGLKWSALGEGLFAPNNWAEVNAMVFHKGKLYVGGRSIGIAVWDGMEWENLCSQGINNSVLDLAFHGDTLYACGKFTKVDDIFVRRVAKWDGSEWHALGGDGSLDGAGGLDGYMNSYVTSIDVENDTVYFGGFFGRAFYQEGEGYISVKSIAKWDGSKWHAAPKFHENITQQIVNDMLVVDGVIYVAGEFPRPGEVAAHKILKLEDGEWQDVGEEFLFSGGGNIGYDIKSILEIDGNLFAGGSLDLVGETKTNYIVWWNGSEWVSLGSGVDSYVNTLASDGEYLYTGGLFSVAGGKVASNVSSYYLQEFKDVLTFSFEEIHPTVKATIAGTKIEAVIPSGIDITALIPTIEVSESSSVSPASGIAQNFTSPVVYTVTATDGSSKEYTVTVVPPSDEKDLLSFEFENYNPAVNASISGTSAELVFPPGTDLTTQIPTTIEVSESATVSPAEGRAQDFSSPVIYTVMAEDGTTKDFSVSASVLISSENDMLSFSIENLNPVVVATITDTNVEVSVPTGTDITALIPTIEISNLATVVPASEVVQDFSSPVVYTVTAEDGSTREYTVTVTVVLSNANDIISFTFDGLDPVVQASISGNTIRAVVPFNTDLTALVPNIEISELASISPGSGIAQDFSSTIIYRVTAENGSIKNYTVIVESISDAKEILSFSFNSLSPPVIATITGTSVELIVPPGTDITSLLPTIEISESATLIPASGIRLNFSETIVYTVIAEDGSQKQYSVNVAFTQSDEADLLSFRFEVLDPVVSASITNLDVEATVPSNTNLTSLVPTIVVSELATVLPASGMAQDFSSPLFYTVTAQNGDEKVYTVHVNVDVDVEQNNVARDELFIYPNPASSKVYFKEVQSVTLFNSQGVLLIAEENTRELDLSSLRPGIYIIRNLQGQMKKIVVK